MKEVIHIRTIRDGEKLFLEIARANGEPARYEVAAKGMEGNAHWTEPENWQPILECAESRFGPRNRDYALLGVALSDTDRPKIIKRRCDRGWAPYDLIIALGDPPTEICGLYALAHECIHVLTPAPDDAAAMTVIEEGLATVFSREMVREYYGVPNWGRGIDGSYGTAAVEVEALLRRAPDAIRRLRAIEPCFRYWTTDTFAVTLPEIDSAHVQRLLAPWIQADHPNPSLEAWAEAEARRSVI